MPTLTWTKLSSPYRDVDECRSKLERLGAKLRPAACLWTDLAFGTRSSGGPYRDYGLMSLATRAVAGHALYRSQRRDAGDVDAYLAGVLCDTSTFEGVCYRGGVMELFRNALPIMTVRRRPSPRDELSWWRQVWLSIRDPEQKVFELSRDDAPLGTVWMQYPISRRQNQASWEREGGDLGLALGNAAWLPFSAPDRVVPEDVLPRFNTAEEFEVYAVLTIAFRMAVADLDFDGFANFC